MLGRLPSFTVTDLGERANVRRRVPRRHAECSEEADAALRCEPLKVQRRDGDGADANVAAVRVDLRLRKL